MALNVGTVIEMTRDAPYKEYNVFKGDIGVINYVARTGKYSVHIFEKSNPHIDAWVENRIYGEQGDFWIPFDYVKEYQYKSGERVKIVSPTSKYKGYCGTIHSETYGNGYCSKMVRLFVDGTDYQPMQNKLNYYTLVKTSVIPLETNNSKGEYKMKLTGYNKVAIIEYCNKDYHYALYDDDINIGDNVLVTGSLENKQTLIIKDIITPDKAKEVYYGTIAAEVKCKINLHAYEQRVKNREEAEKLRKKMDEEIKKMDELNKYEMYADKNPALKEMLELFKSLGV
jgi:hypothetical protein